MENEKGFQVRDRRRFTETGESRAEGDAPEETPAPPTEAPQAKPGGAAEAPSAAAPESAGARAPFEMTLSTFLISLSTQALMCLGEIPDPVSGETRTDLVAVRELIDIIEMLQRKTRGNLDENESLLFEKILFDLRIRFVEKHRK
jgi:hypothetical protein